MDVALERFYESRGSDLKDRHGLKAESRLAVDFNGAVGEMCAAAALGLQWEGSVNVFKVPDVGTFHVRTAFEENYSLIIRDGDPDGIYVLVVGCLPVYKVVGFISSADAKAMDKYRRNPNGRGAAWFIPQHELTPIEDIQMGP